MISVANSEVLSVADSRNSASVLERFYKRGIRGLMNSGHSTAHLLRNTRLSIIRGDLNWDNNKGGNNGDGYDYLNILIFDSKEDHLAFRLLTTIADFDDDVYEWALANPRNRNLEF